MAEHHSTDRDWKREARIWRARAEYLQASIDRMRSLAVAGESAGFLAHELNNLFTPVVGYCQAASAPDADDLLRTKAISKSLAAAERVGELASAILQLSGTAITARSGLLQSSDLLDGVEAALMALGIERWNREKIDVRVSVPRGTTVGTSAGVVQQVVMNLVLNARRAMAGRAGRVEISAREVGGVVRMEVRDRGEGMISKVIERTFGIAQSDDNIDRDQYQVDVQELARSGSINGQARWGVRLKAEAEKRKTKVDVGGTSGKVGRGDGQVNAAADAWDSGKAARVARLRGAKLDASASPIRIWDAEEVARELRDRGDGGLDAGGAADLGVSGGVGKAKSEKRKAKMESGEGGANSQWPAAAGELLANGGSEVGEGGQAAGVDGGGASRSTGGGTGLGVALCLELVGRVGGRMWAESRLGEGTVVYVEWPAAADSRGRRAA